MRLKENTYNYRASGLIRKLAPIPDIVRARSHRNKRKWCKGKVGTPHELQLKEVEESMFPWDAYRVKWVTFECEKCGRKFLDRLST